MKYNILYDKTLNFAVRIVNLHKHLVKTQNEYDLPRQILRSGTSIGANAMESRSAQSTADFVSKLHIALKVGMKNQKGSGCWLSSPPRKRCRCSTTMK